MKRFLVFVACGLGILALLGIARSRRFNRGADSSAAPVADLQPSQNEVEIFTGSPLSEDVTSHLAQVAESDPRGAVALIQQLPEGDRQRDLTRQLLNDLFEKDPVSAAEFIGHLPAPLDSQMASALGSMWGQKDIVGAVAWARDLPAGPVRSQALFSLCADWAAADPQDAAEFVTNSTEADFPLDPSGQNFDSTRIVQNTVPLRDQMLEIIAGRWAANDVRTASAWVAQLPPGSSRDSFVAGLSSTLGETAPEEAADFVATMIPGPRQEGAALTVLLEWGRKDLPAAADWLSLFPAGDFREKALLNLTSISLDKDRESAKSFLLGWPEPDERAYAIRYYLTGILDMDAPRAAEVVPGLPSGPITNEETQRIAQHWVMQDPVAATEWISHLKLDERLDP